MKNTKTASSQSDLLKSIIKEVVNENYTKEKAIRRGDITKIILGVIAMVGVVAAGAVFPNIGGVLSLMGFGKRRSMSSWYINTAIERLLRRGFVLRDKNGGLFLTCKGEEKLLSYKTDPRKTITIPKKWDGKYHLVGFDIWEKSREKRDIFRKEIESAGFIKLQNSLWVFPYECEEFVALLKTEIVLGGGVIYIVADKIENDGKIRKHFGLPACNEC